MYITMIKTANAITYTATFTLIALGTIHTKGELLAARLVENRQR